MYALSGQKKPLRLPINQWARLPINQWAKHLPRIFSFDSHNFPINTRDTSEENLSEEKKLCNYRFVTFLTVNNKGADPPARIRRLSCAFVKQVFLTDYAINRHQKEFCQKRSKPRYRMLLMNISYNLALYASVLDQNCINKSVITFFSLNAILGNSFLF